MVILLIIEPLKEVSKLLFEPLHWLCTVTYLFRQCNFLYQDNFCEGLPITRFPWKCAGKTTDMPGKKNYLRPELSFWKDMKVYLSQYLTFNKIAVSPGEASSSFHKGKIDIQGIHQEKKLCWWASLTLDNESLVFRCCIWIELLAKLHSIPTRNILNMAELHGDCHQKHIKKALIANVAHLIKS